MTARLGAPSVRHRWGGVVRFRQGRNVIAATVIYICGFACSQPTNSIARFLVTDSTGVQIARSTAPKLADHIVVNATPRAVIAADFGSPDRFLVNPAYATHLSDGAIVIGDRGTKELSFFAPDGTFLEAMGGEGQGPGEFEAVFGLHRCGADRLVVEEVSRLSIIDGQSREFEKSVRVVGHLAEGRATLAGLRADCSGALMKDSPSTPPDLTPSTFDFPGTLHWAEFATGERDSIASFAALLAFSWEMDGRKMPGRMPYGAVASWGTTAGEVVLGLARGFNYTVLGNDGRLLRRVEWTMPENTLTDDDWAFYEGAFETFLQDEPAERQFLPPPGYIPRPEIKPAYSRLIVDDAGRVWLNAYGLYGPFAPTPVSEWWIFGTDGEWLANAIMPDELEVLAIGDSTVIGIMRDDLDLQRIQVHAFRLPGTTSN